MSETIADIRAEMRRCADYLPSRQKYVPKLSIRAWRNLADRIEAAVGREIREAAMEHAVLPAVCITKAPQGNAAAMRKALEEQLRYWDAHVRTRDEEEMRERTAAALSAPPRNCDRFSSYAEAANYWHENVECAEVNGCFDVWLFAPAEGGAE